MKPATFVAVACLWCGAAAQAADREFSDVVRAIGDEYNARPTRIPFFGMVNLFTAAAHPAGAKHIDLAVFEDLHGYNRETADNIRRAVGAAWTPFIQVRSDRDHETVFVYMRQTGHDWKLLVVAMEHAEATVVQLLLDADGLARWLSDPEHCARHWDRQ